MSFWNHSEVKEQCKVRPTVGHESPEGKYRYCSTLSLNSILDESLWLKPHPGDITPRERDPVRIVWEAGWAPGRVWTGAENLAPT
jgi:hypothetical protein